MVGVCPGWLGDIQTGHFFQLPRCRPLRDFLLPLRFGGRNPPVGPLRGQVLAPLPHVASWLLLQGRDGQPGPTFACEMDEVRNSTGLFYRMRGSEFIDLSWVTPSEKLQQSLTHLNHLEEKPV